MSKVEDILKNLKHRFDKQKASCNTIFVDDCCKVRSKLQQIFQIFHLYLQVFIRIKEDIPIIHHILCSHLKDATQIIRDM